MHLVVLRAALAERSTLVPTHIMGDTPPTYRPRCIYLSCKSMLVFGENFESDPDYQAGLNQFWCVQTSKGQGPDGDDVALDLCSNPERSCFQEY